MESDTLKEDLINTLRIMKAEEFPVLVGEVLHFFVRKEKTPVENNLLAEKLKELKAQEIVYTNDEGFISLSKNITDKVQHRFKLEEVTKERVRYAQKLLKGLESVPFLRFVGIIGSAPLGRITENESIKLILIVENETPYLSKFLVENYLWARFALKNFQVDSIFETNNLMWCPSNSENGIKILNILPIINKDKTYESFIAANNWIFEIFTNYPLEKVSWGFRVSKNIENNVPQIFRWINGFLRPRG